MKISKYKKIRKTTLTTEKIEFFDTIFEKFSLKEHESIENELSEFLNTNQGKFIHNQVKDELFYHAGINRNLLQVNQAQLSTEFSFYARIQARIKRPQYLIDLGAGTRPFKLVESAVHLLVEPFEPYRDYLRNISLKTNIIIINDDALKFLRSQATSSADLIVAIDLIEHLEKEDGFQLMREMERVTRNQALVITPLGFAPQHVSAAETDGWGFAGNILQTHISGWLPEDFKEWEIISEPNFNYDSNFKGNFAAIYNKEPNLGPVQFEIVLTGTNIDSKIEFLDKLSKELQRNLKIRVNCWLPINFHPESFAIYPGLVLPKNSKFYIENTDLYTDEVPRNFPGKILFEKKSKRFVFGIDSLDLESNFHNFLTQNGCELKNSENLLKFISSNI